MAGEQYGLVLLLGGGAALLAAWVPSFTARRPLSLPIVLVAVGVGIGLIGFGLPDLDPRRHLEVTTRLTELGVLVALMGAGLKIDRPFHWRTWAPTWRMVLLAMPLTIAAVAALGVTVGGLTLASAVLLGAALAPTDPVIASDVQVGEPSVGDDVDHRRGEDQVRFTLTSEGGLNDALAFPFVYLAIRLADTDARGEALSWRLLGEWVAWDVGWRIAVGVAVGLVVGWLMGLVAFRPPGPFTALAERPQGFIAIAAMAMAYGGAELAQGYGFLAVFVAAVTLRSAERDHAFHGELHGFVEQTENLLVVGLLVVLGASLGTGVVGAAWWQPIVLGVALVAVVRPACGVLALLGSTLTRRERGAVAFFGIRGVGSVYYLAYALLAAPFAGADLLWSTVVVALLVSIVVHGVAATPVMRHVDAPTDAPDPLPFPASGR